MLTANTGEDSLTLISFDNGFASKTIFLSELIEKYDSKIIEDSNQLRPLNMALTGDGYILLANSYDNSVMKIDIDNLQILGWIKVGKNPTVIEEFQDKSYVVNTDSNSISVLDTKSFTLIEDIAVGEKPTDIIIDREKCKCYVANSNCYTMNVLDLKSESIDTISLGKQPIKLLLEEEELYVLSYTNNGVMNVSNLMGLSSEDYQVKMNLDLNGIFDDFIKFRGEKTFYLSSADDGYIYKIIMDKKVEIEKTYLGGMPSPIKWDGESKLYIANILNNEICIIDVMTNKILKNLRVGKEPSGILLL